MRIVLLGYLVRGPIGGMAWHHLHYLLGLRALGHDVLFCEDSDDYESCYDPTTHQVGTDPTYGLGFADRTLRRLGVGEDWAYFDAHTDTWHGPAGDRVYGFCRDADVVINVSGVNPLRSWTESIATRILIDTDPVFTQVGHLRDASKRARAAAHTHFFTFGENWGKTGCAIPDDGFPWSPTRQPVTLSSWTVTPPTAEGAYTTVMQWQSYRSVVHGGADYGTKSQSFDEIVDLPATVGPPLEIALGGEAAPRDELRRNGWRLCDPLEVASTPWDYQEYLRSSRGEVSIAKHAYAATTSGWFSERSACYLASGRPVVVQDTGFSSFLPCGEGLHAFADRDGAAAAIESIERDRAAEAARSRAIAEEHFDAKRVLTSLLDRSAS